MLSTLVLETFITQNNEAQRIDLDIHLCMFVFYCQTLFYNNFVNLFLHSSKYEIK